MTSIDKRTREHQIHNELIERGCTYEKKEDRFGDTRSGYWMDGVFLGKTSIDAKESLVG